MNLIDQGGEEISGKYDQGNVKEIRSEKYQGNMIKEILKDTTMIIIIFIIMVNLVRRELPLSSFESLLQSQDRVCTHRVLVRSLVMKQM